MSKLVKQKHHPLLIRSTLNPTAFLPQFESLMVLFYRAIPHVEPYCTKYRAALRRVLNEVALC